MDVPTLILAIPAYDRYGRKATVLVGFFGGLVCMLGMIVGDLKDLESLLRASAFLGKSLVELAFATLFVYSPELFPTALRSGGTGKGSLAARMGGIAAPFVLRGHQRPGLFALSGVTLAAALGVLIYVPETLNKAMPT